MSEFLRINKYTVGCIVALSCCCSFANDYDIRHKSAINRCAAISPDEYQSGLFFNPDGFRSYYDRSNCFQKAAEAFRDAGLCKEVKRRWSLFSSSWGISSSRCLELVAEATRRDHAKIDSIRKQYAAKHVTLTDFEVHRNGNRRDFDIVPVFSGTAPQSYALSFEIVPQLGEPVIIYASGFYLDGPNDRIKLYIRQADIRKLLPSFSMDANYQVRGRLTFVVSSSGPQGYWSDAFIHREFPEATRTGSITKQVNFGRTKFIPYRISDEQN